MLRSRMHALQHMLCMWPEASAVQHGMESLALDRNLVVYNLLIIS